MIAAGKAMDFAVRLHGRGGTLTADLVEHFGLLAGISRVELYTLHLPMLKQADVVDYTLVDDLSAG